MRGHDDSNGGTGTEPALAPDDDRIVVISRGAVVLSPAIRPTVAQATAEAKAMRRHDSGSRGPRNASSESPGPP